MLCDNTNYKNKSHPLQVAFYFKISNFKIC